MTPPRSILPRYKDEQRTGLLTRGQLVVALLLLAGTFYNFYLLQSANARPGIYGRKKLSARDTDASTLVIYVFRNTDTEALNNLQYFLSHGVLEDDGARYLIAMDPTLPEVEMPLLPTLPPNAEIVRPPACFEMGTVGWLLYTNKTVDISNFRRFVWLSSSVRGPFLPVYQEGPWHSLLTQRVRGDVKLVGATISCSVLVIDTAQAPIQHPHIQNYLVATDRTGLGLLEMVGALDCHSNWLDNIRFGEFGASEAILKAYYNLESLMLRYRGVDWRDERNWDCNARIDPQQQSVYDGTSLNPLEVMFVRTDHASLVVSVPHVSQAALYSDWIESRRMHGRPNISSNAWVREAARLYSGVMSRPQACFDAELYIQASPVEFKGYTADNAYAHFKAVGFREGRPYQFFC